MNQELLRNVLFGHENENSEKLCESQTAKIIEDTPENRPH